MANVGRLVVFGCGGLIALVVLIVIVAALVGGGGSDTSTSSSGEPGKQEDKEEKAAQKGEENTTYGLNEPVTVGDASWTVTNAQQSNQLADPFGIDPPRQGNFVIVDFQFTNEGSESKTLTQQALQLEDSSGRTADPDPADFRYIPQDRNIFLEQVNPGVTQQGQVIFSVAPDASGPTLILKDTNLFRSSQNQARVDLGI